MIWWQWLLTVWLGSSIVLIGWLAFLYLPSFLKGKGDQLEMPAGAFVFMVVLAPICLAYGIGSRLADFLRSARNKRLQNRNYNLERRIGAICEDISNEPDSKDAEELLRLLVEALVARTLLHKGDHAAFDGADRRTSDDADQTRFLDTSGYSGLSIQELNRALFDIEPPKYPDTYPKFSFHKVYAPAQERRRQWTLVFSSGFKKTIKKIDKDIQRKAEDAIIDVIADPMTPRGDTVSRLSHNQTGLWRYRIGDYRLIYMPVPKENHIVFLKLAHRSEAYHAN